MLGLNRLHLASALLVLGLAACSKDTTGLTCPPPGDICYDDHGNAVDHDGVPIDQETDGDPLTDEVTDGDGDGDGDSTSTDTGVVDPSEQEVCVCDTTATDSDGDCIPNSLETTTDPNDTDSDDDGVRDGCEDRNFNGQLDSGETDPTNPDSDGDCIKDGLEDKNHNGQFTLSTGETSATLVDSDRDGIDDGVEDANCNGQLDAWVDTSGDGCFNSGETGETSAALNDTDGDYIGDGREDADHDGTCDDTENSCAFTADSDCDKLPDGSEDSNRNGVLNTGETNPRLGDSDNDGLPDGIEDSNLNGAYESSTETDPLNIDSDGDTIHDGVEDANYNGQVDGAVLVDGCWNGQSAETDPRKVDSDADGIDDDKEDKNKNGVCDSGVIDDPNAASGQRTGIVESCSFLADSDCDGIIDGKEDKNHDGTYQISETDARYNDTDRDGLIDGCPTAVDLTSCEDRDNDGVVDTGETDPRSVDTDLDGLTDRCEVQFDPSNCTSTSCTTNPLAEDTDGDGKTDGEEDKDHDCKYEPDEQETDPRVANAPPAVGSADYPKSQVCDAENLKQLTFAASSDSALDYRVAFEVEKFNAVEASYTVQPFGIELTSPNNVIAEDDPDDMVWGHIFESPVGVVVDSQTNAVVNRNVYGFVYATADVTPLDTILDELRDKLSSLYSGAVVEVSNVPARPAHDDHPSTGGGTAYRVYRAQRQYSITVATSASNALSGIQVRQDLLARAFLPSDELSNVRPTTVLGDTTNDPVYGAVQCPSNAQCYQQFTMDIAAVQRPQQQAPSSTGVTLYVVALTPDDSTSNVNDTLTRLYEERLTRLEDLTGGSAVARYEARRSSACEDRNATQARADLLFVVDDSRSMQAVVSKLQQASRDAKAVLDANSNNVDFRVAMTTTNPSQYGRTFCSGSQTASPGTSFDKNINCMTTCSDYTTCNSTKATEAGAVQADGRFIYQLPGGGGTFYYEDTAFMDCKATSSNVIDPCNDVPGFSSFYNGQERVRLTDNAGFLGSDPSADCPTYPVDMNFDANVVASQCANDPSNCCDRLAASCTDGPTVLASQMCDLIRALGGKPDPSSGVGGARPNSTNESGVLSARRLITNMGHAYPLDTPETSSFKRKEHLRLNCTSTGSLTACDNDNDCGSFDYCDLTTLENDKGTCRPTGNCKECDPRAGTTVISNFTITNDGTSGIAGASGVGSCSADSDCGRGERCSTQSGTCIVDCSPVPLVTIFLSDEEDYLFKDECETSHQTLPSATEGWQLSAQTNSDQAQLDTDCYFRDHTLDADGLPIAESCADSTAEDPLEYCRDVAHYVGAGTDFAGFATGYDPDVVPALGIIESMKWRTYDAPECASYTPPAPNASAIANATGTSCLEDPCRVIADQSTCESQNNACAWSSVQNRCVNHCEHYTSEGTPAQLSGRTAQRDACNADPLCAFDTSFSRDDDSPSNSSNGSSISSQLYACQPKFPLNDCQACKRLFRRYGAVLGTDVSGDNLMGFDDVGPVYAIARERGKPGFRDEVGSQAQDQCQGGVATWGRGDGQAFRDIAVDTLGRAQNVCASSYQDFMQLLVTDIVALSAPYKLAESPIAATIKVGIGRLEQDGTTWDYIEVPRSNTQGFVYDATSNSIGFKSDPIDGDCPGYECSADGTITQGEIDAASNIEEVPRTDDLVFISYRFWRVVPCVDGCPVGETCVRSLCPSTQPTASCTVATQEADCPSGAVCDGTNQCVYDCTDDGYLERCVPDSCDECETYNETTGACDAPSGSNAQCTCFDEEETRINCDPFGADTCPAGLYCDETCVCLVSDICNGGFNDDGTVKDCQAALDCCARFAACADNTTSSSCAGDANACEWDGTKCVSQYTTCCEAGEEAVCYQPVEDPSRTVFGCQGESCSCTTTQECTTDADCSGNVDSFGNGAGKCLGESGDKHCDCNSQTQSCLTNSGGGCECKQTPG